MFVRSILMAGAAMCALAITAGVAAAQNAGSSTQVAQNNTGGIETVTVTARHRAESIQDAPLTVTAVDAAQIEKLFVRDLTDLNYQAPNFTIQGVGAIDRNAAVIYSRGIGYSNVDQGQDPAVGVSVNGVFSARNIGQLSNMLDVDNVQILTGPQGTLFGKNTVGGVVNITTKLPGDVYDAEVSARYGNLGRQDYFGAVDMPIDDTLSVRISLQSQYSDGAFKNAYVATPPNPPGPKNLGGDDTKTGRGTVVWKPVSNFEAVFVGTYMDDRNPSPGGTNGSTPTDALTYWDPPYSPISFGAPGIYAGYDYGGRHDPYTVYRNFPSGDFQDTTSLSLNMRYHGDGFDVVSVTGFERDWNFDYNDYANIEQPFFESTYVLHSTQSSEEVRVESNTGSDFKWQFGDIFSTRTWNASQLFYSVFPTLNNFVDYAKQLDNAEAAFGQVDYTILPGLDATGGIRWTSEMKDMDRVNSHLATNTGPCDIVSIAVNPTNACNYINTKTFTNVSYHVGLDYHIDADKMVYGSYSTGFVAGGWNDRVDTAFLADIPYASETAAAWEVGIKSDWLDNRLRANLAAFKNTYSNLQFSAFIPGGGLQQAIVNTASQSANGLELETTALPLEHWLITGSLGWLDTKYTTFYGNVYGTGNANYSALTPPFSSKYTMRLESSYEFGLYGHGTLTPDIAYSFQSKYYTDPTDSPVGLNNGYGLLSSSLTYEDPQGRYKIALWGKNLTDTLYRLAAVPSSGYFTQLYFANPRTFGLDLTIKMQEK
jgi:iron complex outermembrane receptor protein